MSIERERWGAPVAFCCDNCGEIEDTHCEEFSGALAKIKSHGWQARNIGGDWFHYCSDCKGAIPYERR